jgi:acetolactate synthase I/III small subunit
MEQLNPISVLVRNERGVLARVAGLFARRGFNIISLAVGETENPDLSRITVVIQGDAATRQQVVKQLLRLVSVIKADDLSATDRVERGLAMIRVKADPAMRPEITQLVTIFRARIDHVDLDSMIVEVTGSREKVQALTDMLRPYGILEMARTGQIVLARSSKPVERADDRAEDLAEGQEDDPQAIYNFYSVGNGDK